MIKGKIGIDRGMERSGSDWRTERRRPEIHIIKKRNVFAYGAADTFETAPAPTAGRLTALGRCEARHRGIFRK